MNTLSNPDSVLTTRSYAIGICLLPPEGRGWRAVGVQLEGLNGGKGVNCIRPEVHLSERRIQVQVVSHSCAEF